MDYKKIIESLKELQDIYGKIGWLSKDDELQEHIDRFHIDRLEEAT